jgi:hypothetical protein
MSSREYVKGQIDILPDSVVEKVQEFILFQRFSLGIFDNYTDYLNSIPGMTESILEGKATPISECLDSVGWDIN